MENNNKKRIKSNLNKYSYNAQSNDDYLTPEFDLIFNKKIVKEIEQMLPKRLVKDKKIVFVKNEDPQNKKSPIRLKPIQFFNLFYHELDNIKNIKQNPDSIIPRLKGIKLLYFDKLYFYSKLIDVLLPEEDNYNKFIRDEIEEEYNLLFDLLLGLEVNNLPKHTGDSYIEFYDAFLKIMDNNKNALEALYEIESFDYQLHEDAKIDGYLKEKWLKPNIIHYEKLIKNGITKREKPKEIQELIDILTDNYSSVDGLNCRQNENSYIKLEIENAFSFMQKTDPRSHKQILNETDFSSLVNWITYYFENDFKIPQIEQPILKINTSKGNVVFAFTSFFKQIHPVKIRPESLFYLIKACFYQYRDDNIENMKKVKEPQYFKYLL
jgi:hypothetical protein